MLLTQNFRPRQSHHQQQLPNTFYPHQLDLDSSTIEESSISSSPLSTQSLLSQYITAAQPTFESVPAIAIPRQAQGANLLGLAPSTSPATFDEISLGQSQPSELMQSDSWLLGGQYTPKSIGRFSHNRESSLSSLGSAGPASPFNHNTSNPQIAVTDSAGDGFGDMHAQDGYHYQLAKTMAPAAEGLYSNYHHFNGDSSAVSDMVYPSAIPMNKPRNERGLLPAPDFSGAFGQGRSHPASVASSIAGDSPATPSLGEPEDDRRRKVAFHNVPKLDRTMTDVYGDELYSPNFTITSASSQMNLPASPSNDVFAQRLHAANNQHLSAAAHSPVSTDPRSRSPFRQGSPLAPMPSHDFGMPTGGDRVRFNPAQQMREQQKADREARAFRQQLTMKSEPETPKTISPKDAILEFNEPDGEANFPLFPAHDSSAFLYDQTVKAPLSQISADPYHRSPSTSGAGSSPFPFSQLTTGIQVPQQYPFIAHARAPHESPQRLSSAESSSGDSSTILQKPAGTGADGGTYTCTYHGCTLRFETPALLQKHKREGHRQNQGLTGTRRPDPSMTSSLLNSQAGPHRCDRINPSTGKPCNTIFSRPYDLTRHEDTIHNGRKQKVRCNLCTEEKTFSRADALTRHYRVCHPDIEFPGKHRRRGGHN